MSSSYVKDASISRTGDYGYSGGICGSTGEFVKLSACYFYESDNNHNIIINGDGGNIGYMIADVYYGSFSDCFTNLSDDSISLFKGYYSGTKTNCYKGVVDKDTFTGKTWSDGSWSDYKTINATNWPPKLDWEE